MVQIQTNKTKEGQIHTLSLSHQKTLPPSQYWDRGDVCPVLGPHQDSPEYERNTQTAVSYTNKKKLILTFIDAYIQSLEY